MYDLYTRPDQDQDQEEMEACNEATGPQRQDARTLEEQNRSRDKTVPNPTNSTSMLGKRHHSLYASLSGFEIEGMKKVRAPG